MGRKRNKTIFDGIINFVLILVIILVTIFIIFATIYIVADDEDSEAMLESLTSIFSLDKKEEINALVCGVNDNMTDTIIYVKYNVKTGKVGMMSIPRDTSIAGSKPSASASNKINSLYRGNYPDKLVSKVEELLDVDIDYYLFFDSKMLIEMVDTLGGIEVEVPMRMKYDDPTQNLHIDLYPGLQVLNGKEAEQFVRFRKNNDGTGYALGDVDRTNTQQEFIKKFISEVLKAKNITKIKKLIDIALDGTDTNITLTDALKYVTAIRKVDTESIITYTAPGTFYDAKYPVWVSFWILDETEARRIITEDFVSNE